MQFLAHITHIELPLGVLLFFGGFATGALAVFLHQRRRTPRQRR